ncbi:MAG: hypothetical protein HRT72_03190 [Flavobacteriales bacterium]|nr:hypothetical protein [Flavobacteriales bacterium]
MEIGIDLLKIDLKTTEKNAETFTNILNDVYKNREQIEKRKQKVRLLMTKGLAISQEGQEEVVNEMKAINSLQAANKQKLEVISSQTDSIGNLNISGIIEDLNESNSISTNDISNLKDELVNLNFQLDVLNFKLDSISFEQIISSGVVELFEYEKSTAFYCIGTYNELSKQNILKRKGGVVGLGRVSVIVKNFNKETFKRININKLSQIKTSSKSLEILSNHPISSYEIEDSPEGKILIIKDNMLFCNQLTT